MLFLKHEALINKCTNSLKTLTYTFFLIATASFNFCVASEWQKVYLASYPRSGNHWVRFLIEEATGIATGSVYPDQGGIDHNDPDALHLPYLFPWEGYCTNHGYNGNRRYPRISDFVVIKTHYPSSQPSGELRCLTYIKAICLIRHPLDSFYSFFLYQNYISNDPDNRMPTDRLKNYIRCWKQFYKFWEEQKNVLFIRYEDLYENPHEYFTEILSAIGNSFSDEDVQRAINKYPPKGGMKKHFHHFSEQDKEFIKYELQDFLVRYGYEI